MVNTPPITSNPLVEVNELPAAPPMTRFVPKVIVLSPPTKSPVVLAPKVKAPEVVMVCPALWVTVPV